MTTQINGDTGVSQCQPNSVSQDDLQSGVVGRGPAFDVYLSADQTVSNGSDTKIRFNTKVFDTTAAFDVVTNYRFQPTIPGYYQFNIRFRASATTAMANFNVMLYKNGAMYARASEYVGGDGPTIAGSLLVYLNGSTDYVEFLGYVVGTGALAFATAGNSTGFYGPRVSGFLARAA